MSEKASEPLHADGDALELSDLGLDDILDAAGLRDPLRGGTRERIDAALARVHDTSAGSNSGGFGDLEALELDDSAPEVSFSDSKGKPFRYSAPPVPGFEDTDANRLVHGSASFVDPHAQTMAEPSPPELARLGRDEDVPLGLEASGEVPTLVLDRPEGAVDLLERGMARRGYTPHAPRAVTSAGTPAVVVEDETEDAGDLPPLELDVASHPPVGLSLSLDVPSEPVLDAIVVEDDESELPLDAEVIEAHAAEVAASPRPGTPVGSNATHYLADLPDGVAARIRRESASPTERAHRKRVIHDADARVLGRARVASRAYDGALEERNSAMERERERSIEALLRAYVDAPSSETGSDALDAEGAEIMRPRRGASNKKR
jgi:hypothetical protein